MVTMVPTLDTVTRDTVPLITTVLLTETVPVTTAVTVPVATTIKPVAVAVSPLLAVVNAACERLTVPEMPIG